MPTVCGIRFQGVGRVYYFAPKEGLDLEAEDAVIVETARGLELGRVVFAERDVLPSQIVGELKPVLRKARTEELLDAVRFQHKEQSALASCRERVAELGLPMKIMDAEYSYDGSRLTFYFAAEQRVDFRDLVRDLARSFGTRIDLRQIGVRDEAKLLGGIGKCGRSLCCATWLTGFAPVSIRMAKNQNLPLSPSEISGQCGRLLCCLRYEEDLYRAVKKEFPKEGRTVETELGPAKVLRVDALSEQALVRFEDGSTMSLTAAQLRGEEPLAPPDAISLADEQREALQSVLAKGQRVSKESPPEREASAAAASGSSRPSREQEDTARDAQEKKPRRRSRRRRPRSPQTREDKASPEDGSSSEAQASRGRSRRRSTGGS